MPFFGLRLNGFRAGCVLDDPRGYTYSEALTPLASESNSIKGPMTIRGAGMGTLCGVQTDQRRGLNLLSPSLSLWFPPPCRLCHCHGARPGDS